MEVRVGESEIIIEVRVGESEILSESEIIIEVR